MQQVAQYSTEHLVRYSTQQNTTHSTFKYIARHHNTGNTPHQITTRYKKHLTKQIAVKENKKTNHNTEQNNTTNNTTQHNKRGQQKDIQNTEGMDRSKRPTHKTARHITSQNNTKQRNAAHTHNQANTKPGQREIQHPGFCIFVVAESITSILHKR